MLLTIVVAACDNNVIGKGNELLYRLPKDFARMKALTMGKPLIMGRKTHESIGRVLPGRRNIVITRHPEKVMKGAEAVGSLTEAIDLAEKSGAEEAVIFGGAQIYIQILPFVSKIHLTRIHASPEGDAFFPEIEPTAWKEVFREEHSADNEHPVAFTFIDYVRQ
jgi:dihydrofolate reductase